MLRIIESSTFFVFFSHQIFFLCVVMHGIPDQFVRMRLSPCIPSHSRFTCLHMGVRWPYEILVRGFELASSGDQAPYKQAISHLTLGFPHQLFLSKHTLRVFERIWLYFFLKQIHSTFSYRIIHFLAEKVFEK